MAEDSPGGAGEERSRASSVLPRPSPPAQPPPTQPLAAPSPRALPPAPRTGHLTKGTGTELPAGPGVRPRGVTHPAPGPAHRRPARTNSPAPPPTAAAAPPAAGPPAHARPGIALGAGTALAAGTFADGILLGAGLRWAALGVAVAVLTLGGAAARASIRRTSARRAEPVGHPAPPPDPGGAGWRVETDRAALRDIGVDEDWVGRLAGADRFGAVRAMLAAAPGSGGSGAGTDLDLVAVIGTPGPARREAHRIAVDLLDGDRPRRVLAVTAGPFRERNLLDARRSAGPAVVVVECDPSDPEGPAALRLLGAGLVVAVAGGAEPDRDLVWLSTLGRIDAVAVDAQPGVAGLLTLLELGVPLARVDGVSTDPLSFAAVICAYLSDRENAGQPARSGP